MTMATSSSPGSPRKEPYERPELVTMVEDAWRWHTGHPGGYADSGVTPVEAAR